MQESIHASGFREAASRTCAAWVKLTHRMITEGSVWRTEQGFGGGGERFLDILNEAAEADESGLTTIMLARGAAEDMLHTTSFTGHTLIHRRKDVEAGLAEIQALWDEVDNPVAAQALKAFRKVIEDGLKHYGVTEEKTLLQVRQLLEDPLEFAFLRRDALVAANKRLRIDQFSWGEPAAKILKVSTALKLVMDINGALVAIKGFADAGMLLVAFPAVTRRGGEEWRFGFIIRNGGTVTLAWEENKESRYHGDRWNHPRPWHSYEAEAKMWFPDSMIQKMAGREAEDADSYVSLGPANPHVKTLGELSQAHPRSIVYLIMLQDALNQRFGERNECIATPSFTARMVREPQLLSGGTLALPAPKLDAGPVTPKHVAPKSKKRPKLPAHLQWMEDRYGDKVPAALFDVIGKSEVKALPAIIGEKPDPDEDSVFGRDKKDAFEYVSEQQIGTAEELEQLRLEVAFANKVNMIQRLADEEYEATRADFEDWLHKAVLKRREHLIEAAARGEYVAKVDGQYGFGHSKPPRQDNILVQAWGPAWRDVMSGQLPTRATSHDDEDHVGPRSRKTMHIHGGDEIKGESHQWRANKRVLLPDYGPGFKCAVKPERWATCFTCIKPTGPESLAQILGMKAEDLPWQIRHWYADDYGPEKEERYEGPRIHNPWNNRNLDMTVGVSLSKEGYDEVRKKLGLPLSTKNRDKLVFVMRRHFSPGEATVAVCTTSSKKAFNRMTADLENYYGRSEAGLVNQTRTEDLSFMVLAQQNPDKVIWKHPETGEWALVEDWAAVRAAAEKVFNEQKLKEHFEKNMREAAEKAERDAKEVRKLKEELGIADDGDADE